MAENYVVSALKYRPQTFDTVVGQEHITTTLKNAIKTGHIAHSFLFCGPRGVGKTTCARILAKTINCHDITPEGEACNACSSCVSFNDNTSFTIYELDAASNNSVEDIRELNDQVRFAPQGAKYKIYIIDEVHMLSGAAFNAFLKTLEEPPSYAIFIMATTEKHKILPTILSRCQIFDFRRIMSKDEVKHLAEICEKENIEFEEDALRIISDKSEGCMRDALSILDKIASFSNNQITYANTLEHLNILDYDYYFRFVEAMTMQDTTKVLLLLDEILKKGFECDTIMNGMAEHFRNLLICKDVEMAKLLDVPDTIKAKFYHQANQVQDMYILNGLSICNQGEIDLKMARNKRLHLEMCFIKLCHLHTAFEVLLEDNTLVKKNFLNKKKQVVYRFRLPKLQVEDNLVHEEELTYVNEEIKPGSDQKTERKQKEKKERNKEGLSFLKNIREKAKQEVAFDKENRQPVILTLSNVKHQIQQCFDQYLKQKQFLKTHFELCIVELRNNEIVIHGPKLAISFLETEINKVKRDLIDVYHRDDFTISLHYLEEDKTPEIQQSKREIFEEMAKKNPHLYTLRDKFGFQIEF